MPDGPERHAEGNGYIRRLDPDYVSLVGDVEDVRERLDTLEKSNARQERYLVGGWADDGVNYVTGIRDRLEQLAQAVTAAVTQNTQAVARVEERERSTNRRYTALAAGAWAVFLAVVGVLAEIAFKGH